MATIRLAEAFGGTSYVEIETDASDRVVLVRGRNATIDAMRNGRSSGPRYTKTFGDTEESIAVPTAAANRIQMTVRRLGWDGLNAFIELIGPGQRA